MAEGRVRDKPTGGGLLKRGELTTEERQAHVAKYMKLISDGDKYKTDRPKKKGRGRPKSWLQILAEDSNTPLSTLKDWYSAFRSETGVKEPPGQAGPEIQAQFAEWLDARQRKKKADDDAKEARKSREAEERASALRMALKPVWQEDGLDATTAILKEVTGRRWSAN